MRSFFHKDSGCREDNYFFFQGFCLFLCFLGVGKDRKLSCCGQSGVKGYKDAQLLWKHLFRLFQHCKDVRESGLPVFSLFLRFVYVVTVQLIHYMTLL